MLLKTAIVAILAGPWVVAAVGAESVDVLHGNDESNHQSRELWHSARPVSCHDHPNPCYSKPGAYLPSSKSPKHFVQCGAHGECYDGHDKMCMQGDGALGHNVWCPSSGGCQHACLCEEYKHNAHQCPKKHYQPTKPGHPHPPHKYEPQCDVPKIPKRETREECCPCCDRDTCEDLALTLMPLNRFLPEPLQYDPEELAQSYYKLAEYTEGQSDQCSNALQSYAIQTFLELSDENDDECMNGTMIIAKQIGDEMDSQRIISMLPLIGVRRPVDQRNVRFLKNPAMCPYDPESGDLLDEPQYGDNPICDILPGICDAFCLSGGLTRPKPIGVVSNSFFKCCAETLGVELPQFFPF